MPSNSSLPAKDQYINIDTVDTDLPSNLGMRKAVAAGFITLSLAGVALIIAGSVTQNRSIGLSGVGILLAMVFTATVINHIPQPTGNLNAPTATAATETSLSHA